MATIATETLAGRANEAAREVVNAHIAEGRETGMQVVAYYKGEKIVDIAAGHMGDENETPVTPDTLFNVFSVSKAICDVALWIQIDRGLIDLDKPMATYWPEFAQNGKAAITVRQVLLHRSGVPQMPDGTTPDRLLDWEWVIRGLEQETPIFEPGTSAYQCMSQGYMLGEIIQRTDPSRRSYRQFVTDEIATPLHAPDLHHGLDPKDRARVATMVQITPSPFYADGHIHLRSIPKACYLGKPVWDDPRLQEAVTPSVGGIYNARSEARFWAMLAGQGQLDGVRVLKEETVRSFVNPVPPISDEPDPVIRLRRLPLGEGGIWLSQDFQPAFPGRGKRVLTKPGFGHSTGWADIDNDFAVAICHNQLFNPHDVESCRMTPIGDAIRDVLNIRYDD